MPKEIIAMLVLLFLIVLFLLPNIKIVGQNQALVVERFGAFSKIIDTPGIHFIVPLIDRVIQSVDLIEQSKHHTFHIKMNENNVISCQMHMTYQITDPVTFVYAALDSLAAVMKYMEPKISDTCTLEVDVLEDIQTLATSFGIEIKKIEFDNK